MLPRPLPGPLPKDPYLGYVDFDHFTDDVEFVEPVDDLQSLVDGFDVQGEVIRLVDGARLEPLDDACFALAGARNVGPPSDPAERTGCEGIVECVSFDLCASGDVVSTAVILAGGWEVAGVSVDAACAPRDAGALGVLVGRVGRPRQVAAAGDTLARGHGCVCGKWKLGLQ